MVRWRLFKSNITNLNPVKIKLLSAKQVIIFCFNCLIHFSKDEDFYGGSCSIGFCCGVLCNRREETFWGMFFT